MPQLPRGFPIDLSDDDLDATLSKMLERVHAWSQDFDRLLPALQLDLITAARAEKGRPERLGDLADLVELESLEPPGALEVGRRLRPRVGVTAGGTSRLGTAGSVIARVAG